MYTVSGVPFDDKNSKDLFTRSPRPSVNHTYLKHVLLEPILNWHSLEFWTSSFCFLFLFFAVVSFCWNNLFDIAKKNSLFRYENIEKIAKWEISSNYYNIFCFIHTQTVIDQFQRVGIYYRNSVIFLRLEKTYTYSYKYKVYVIQNKKREQSFSVYFRDYSIVFVKWNWNEK